MCYRAALKSLYKIENFRRERERVRERESRFCSVVDLRTIKTIKKQKTQISIV